MIEKIEQDLKAQFEGEVHFDPVSRRVYSVDASIFEVEPLGVAVPRSHKDLKHLLQVASSYQIPITPRGAATGIAGGALGRGIILDTSKYLNRLLEINLQEKWVICEPGLIQDHLNQQLAPLGYRLGPDTSTGNRATIGGMIANNASGARSLYFGSIADHLLGVNLLLSTGDHLSFNSLSAEEWEIKSRQLTQEGLIYSALSKISHSHEQEIKQRLPHHLPRRSSGYLLDRIFSSTDDGMNAAPLIAGSEGTLGVITQAKLKIVPALGATSLVLIFFDAVTEALDWIPELLGYHPLSLEMLDHTIIELGRNSPDLKKKLDWLTGNPKLLLAIEFEHTSDAAQLLFAAIQRRRIGYSSILLSEALQVAQFWSLRKAGLGLLLSKRSYTRAIAFIEDLSVPPQHLSLFMGKLLDLFKKHQKTAGIYGHAGAGCLHIRPYFDLRQENERALMHHMMEEVAELVLEMGGALSGEHGDGLIRSWLNPQMFGPRLMEAFQMLKTAFDPIGLMNPGKIIPLSASLEETRTTPLDQASSFSTFLNFEKEGGFALAADLCNGNGLCRKKEGLMCPSFQATQDEQDSTRARAQALRGLIQGRLSLDELAGPDLNRVMDLCISCKGCKTECPSQIDMSKMKSEFLYHQQELSGYSMRSRIFASMHSISSFLSPFASLHNWLVSAPFTKKVLQRFGIARERTLPLLAHQRFSSWFARYQQPLSLRKSVVILNDTFNEFYSPHIGQAAVRLLNAVGYKVIVPPLSCCGRPALSKGVLKQAKKQADRVLETLEPFLSEQPLIIGLEPSCLYTIKEDLQSLFPSFGKWTPLLKYLETHVLTLDAFLEREVPSDIWKELISTERKKIAIHGHCHQKALSGMEATIALLRRFPNWEVEEIASGCRGMAGSFGYEKEHYAISMKIGELTLFPSIRQLSREALLVANGFSCRHQIEDATTEHPLHLAELLESSLL